MLWVIFPFFRYPYRRFISLTLCIIVLKTDFNQWLYFFEKHSSGFNIHPIDFEKLVLCPYYFILNVRIIWMLAFFISQKREKLYKYLHCICMLNTFIFTKHIYIYTDRHTHIHIYILYIYYIYIIKLLEQHCILFNN